MSVRIIADLCGLDVIQLHGHEPAEQAACTIARSSWRVA